MILVTGASGQLGQLVVNELLAKIPASEIAILVRNSDKYTDLQEKGVDVRIGDYDDVASLERAFTGIEKMLFISSSAIGQRIAQHTNVIDAAIKVGVKYIAYTSVLRADTSSLILAKEHVFTENYLRESGIAFTMLRHGWYSENYLMAIHPALQMGAVYGAAGEGKITPATRADFAAFDAAIMLGTGHEGKTYEVVGDEAFTMSEFALFLSKITGKQISYVNITEEAYANSLAAAGLPLPLAQIVADADRGASVGDLYAYDNTLSSTIGRATTKIATLMENFTKAL